MTHSELSDDNFKRISFINWVLSIPLILIFGWPFLYLCSYLKIGVFFAYTGAFIFSLPFMFTILHGHVTMALGAAHRHHYYNWLTDRPYTYGLLFHDILTKTRFRLALLAGSGGFLLLGYLLA